MNHALIFIIGIVAGFINVNAGGGSFLTIPALIFIGLPPSVANATNRIGIFVMTIVAILTFRAHGVNSIKFSSFLAIPAVIGAYFGARLSMDLSPTLFKQILSLLMIVMLGFILHKPRPGSESVPIYSFWRNAISFVGFFFVGLYGGFIQAGVGYIMILILRSNHNLSLKEISSIRVSVVFFFIIIPIILFIRQGQVDWTYAATLVPSVSLGGWLGTKWNVKHGDAGVKVILAISLIILAARLWWS